MYCPSCHNTLNGVSPYCSSCGHFFTVAKPLTTLTLEDDSKIEELDFSLNETVTFDAPAAPLVPSPALPSAAEQMDAPHKQHLPSKSPAADFDVVPGALPDNITDYDAPWSSQDVQPVREKGNFVWSVIATLLCLPVGLVALKFSLKSLKSFDERDYVTGQRCVKISQMLTVASVLVAVTSGVLLATGIIPLPI